MSARGEQRREALVAAAAALLGRDGPHALSARAVAAEAQVPLAAVSYYFDTVDDLVRAAAEQLYDGYLRVATALVDDVAPASGPLAERDAAALVVRVWLDPTEGGPDPQRVRSLLVSLASVAAAPALAPRLRRYDQLLQGLVVRVLDAAGRDPGRVRVLLAALDGFALARLSGVPLLPTRGAERAPDLPPTELLGGLTADLLLLWDDLAPPLAQNNRAVGSSRPDRAT